MEIGGTKIAIPVERRRHARPEPDAWTYEMLDRRQREIAHAIANGGGEGRLLLSEVAPVVTLGRRTPDEDISRELLEARGIPVYPTDRGGLGTYHGPGQWVLFAVERLERLTGDPRGVRKAVCALLEVAREVALGYDRRAEIREGAELGVWGANGKCAALGIHVQGGVVLHGISVNGFRTSESFVGLRPCGLDAPVQFLLEDESGFERLGDELEAAAQRVFGFGDDFGLTGEKRCKVPSRDRRGEAPSKRS
jgi:lipoate-protein ligase B